MSVDHSARAKKLTAAELAFELRELALHYPSEGFDYLTEAARRLRPAKPAPKPAKAKAAKPKAEKTPKAAKTAKVGDTIA